MFNKLIPFNHHQYKALNIVIVESSQFHRVFLAKAIAHYRPYHQITIVDDIEAVFNLMYQEVKIDVIFFDIEPQLDINNLAIINAIAPEISFVHWSDCRHPEIIELLHSFEVNSFCLKDSTPPTLIAAIDSIVTNPKILYIDKRLNQCLPLLSS